MAKEKQPDIILMDINLPGMNGITALKQLQKMQETKDIPVIAISAAAMPEEVENGIDAGFCQYLTKPINVQEVLSAISKHVD